MYEINTPEDLKVFTSMHSIALLDVWADWCNPCKMFAPKFKELEQQYSVFKVGFGKTESNKNVIKDVRGLPSILIFEKGQLVHTVLGADMNELKQHLSKWFPAPPDAPTPPPPPSNSQTNYGKSSRGSIYKSYGSMA